MAAPQEAQQEVMDRLHDHFDLTSDYLKPEQISEMTGLDKGSVTNALRVLHKGGWIEGVTAEELDYPLLITGIRHEAE